MAELIKIEDFLAELLHRHLVSWCADRAVFNYLPGGIFQFYPQYIKFTKHHMYVQGQKGSTIVIPQPDLSGFWERARDLHAEFNKGACV